MVRESGAHSAQRRGLWVAGPNITPEGRKRWNPSGVVIVVVRPSFLHVGDNRGVRGSQRRWIWGGADRSADAGLRAACTHRGICDNRADGDHLDTSCKPRMASRGLAAIRDDGVLLSHRNWGWVLFHPSARRGRSSSQLSIFARERLSSSIKPKTGRICAFIECRRRSTAFPARRT